MFDLNWYKKMLFLISEATRTIQFAPMTIAQYKSNSNGSKKLKNFNSSDDIENDVINITEYLFKYLNYFDLKLKEQFHENKSNKHFWI